MDVLTDKDVTGLLEWYRQNRRTLPWRDTDDPYDLLLSEVMLQQTRVEAVIEYFKRFKREVPDIAALAQIDDEKLMRLWEGLGYYSRARNLKRCAIQITEEYNGKIPCDHEKLLSLTGVGPYSAGAIASIGFDLPYPAVDGNVLRVMARYLGIKEDIRSEEVKRRVTEVIGRHYDASVSHEKGHYRDLTQAFMELGALVCIPNGKPLCEGCPWRENCFACIEDLTDRIPYRSHEKKRKTVERTVLIIRYEDSFLIRKRPEKGLLAGMYEFIGLEEKADEDEVRKYLEERDFKVSEIHSIEDARHIFSHVEWQMRGYEIILEEKNKLKENEIWATGEELQGYALPSAFRTYIDRYGLRKKK